MTRDSKDRFLLIQAFIVVLILYAYERSVEITVLSYYESHGKDKVEDNFQGLFLINSGFGPAFIKSYKICLSGDCTVLIGDHIDYDRSEFEEKLKIVIKDHYEWDERLSLVVSGEANKIFAHNQRAKIITYPKRYRGLLESELTISIQYSSLIPFRKHQIFNGAGDEIGLDN